MGTDLGPSPIDYDFSMTHIYGGIDYDKIQPPGLRLKECSYLIYEDSDGTIDALNGFTGQIDFTGPPGSDPVIVINQALAALPATGGMVFIKTGIYNSTVPLTIQRDGTTILAEGNSTVLNYSGGGQAIEIAADNVKIRDLRVNIVAGAGGGGTRPNCIHADGQTDIELSHLSLIGDQTVGDDGSNYRQCGIRFSNVTDSRITLCTIEDTRRQGIIIRDSDNNTIALNMSRNCIGSGFVLAGSRDNTLKGNQSLGNGGGFSLMSSAADVSQDNTLIGNKAQGNTWYGIDLYEVSDRNHITGNTLTGNGQSGIYLSDSHRNIIGLNQCQLNGDYGITLDSSDFNKVTNNYTNGNTNGSINVSNAGCNNNTVEFNTTEEGAFNNAGVNTRGYGNYDPSANAFVGDVGAPPF